MTQSFRGRWRSRVLTFKRPVLGMAVVFSTAATAAMLAAAGRSASADENEPALITFPDPSGQVGTLNVNGELDLDNPFFQDLGTNGRRCVTCHQPSDAWTITLASVQERFAGSHGTDPISRLTTTKSSPSPISTSRSASRAAGFPRISFPFWVG